MEAGVEQGPLINERQQARVKRKFKCKVKKKTFQNKYLSLRIIDNFPQYQN